VDIPKALVLIIIPAGFLVLTAQFLRNLATSLGSTKAGAQEAAKQKPASEPTKGSPDATAEGRQG
jgi:hypothetical protein